ncbi:MAG: hypothetical protein EXS09_09995 [Gemmataceae bacterium]|nr:hypothetical protein [Gemmataceae bacterium]
MKFILAAFMATIVMVGFSAAQEKKVEPAKIDAAKFLGTWELTKSADKDAPKGAIVVFEKDGKVSITAKIEGKEEKFAGKYAVKGDKLVVTIDPPGGGKGEEQSDTIKSLTDDKAVLVDKDGQETELTKKK